MNEDEQQQKPEKDYMTVDDFARDHGVGRSFVYYEIKRGHLIAHKLGRKTIILNESAADYWRNLPKMVPTPLVEREFKKPIPKNGG